MSTRSARRGTSYEESGHKRILKARSDDFADDEESWHFPRGSLKRLTMKNFMTFSEATVDFEPCLNVFLAPNGTGKSSVVCALCIGLGGKPQLLARQSRLSEFVRRGEEFAVVEVILSCGESSEACIKRKLYSDKEASEWNLDGCPATSRDIERFVKSMNIQLDNLLQLMPQDRVSEFASLSPIRLLEETERAIDPELYTTHLSLVEMGKTLTANNQKTKTIENDLKRVTGLMRGLERDVERLRQVAVLQKELNQIEAKTLVLSMNKTKEDLAASLEHFRKGEEDVKQKEQQLRTLSDSLLAIRKKKDKTQSVTASLKTQIGQKENLSAETIERIEKEEEMIEDKILQLKNLAVESEKWKDKISRLKERAETLKKEIQENPSLNPELKRQCEDLSALCSETLNEIHSVQSGVDGLKRQKQRLMRSKQEIERQIERLDNVNIRLVQKLEQRRPLFRGLVHAYESLKQHTEDFRMPVIGPLITEINVRDPTIALYLENQVPDPIWTLFIVQCEEDHQTIKSLQLMRELNVINFGGSGNEAIRKRTLSPRLSELGVTGCLMDLFDAPNIVKNTLDSECGLSRTLVGTEASGQHVTDIFDADPEIYRVYTPVRCYTCTKSRYADTSSVSTTTMHESGLLAGAQDTAEERPGLERQYVEIEQEIQKVLQAEKAKQEDLEAVRSDYEDAKIRRDEVERQRKDAERRRINSTRRLNETEKEIERIEQMPDPLTMETERKEEIHHQQNNMLEMIKSMKRFLFEAWSSQEKLAPMTLLLERERQQCADSESKVQVTSNKIDEQKRLVAQLKDYVKADRIRLRRSENELREKFPDIDEWTVELESLPSDSNELEDLASEKKYKAKMLTCNNPDAMASYEQLQSQVSSLESQLETRKAEFQQVKTQVEQTKRDWLVKLKECIGAINEAFMDNFLAIGCIGQIALAGEEVHGLDFQNYSLEIKVKFRAEEPLKILDSVRQSGGERVVATTLYLLSLQSVSRIPFRVMDEINHGMDEENERRVMGILAGQVRSASMPQTLLLTPKMFHNPEFLEHATCHLIANGHVNIPRH